MPSTVIKRISDTAEKLYDVRKTIERIEDENKANLEDLKAERDALQNALLEDLRKNELSSIKTKGGDTFTKAVRKGLEVTDMNKAIAWASEHHAVSIDKIRVAAMLRDAKEYPDGFIGTETEYISVRKAKQKHEEI